MAAVCRIAGKSFPVSRGMACSQKVWQSQNVPGNRFCSLPRRHNVVAFRACGDRVSKTWTGVSCPTNN